tara:strand:+ start:422 stop:754 length:333 start_codon:yes stop_codon:yes gene_type:complete
MVVNEAMVDAALHLLIDTAEPHADWIARAMYCTEFRKVRKALGMRQAELDGYKTAALQEREAYAADSYNEHLLELFEAVKQKELIHAKRKHAEQIIELWRTQRADERQKL